MLSLGLFLHNKEGVMTQPESSLLFIMNNATTSSFLKIYFGILSLLLPTYLIANRNSGSCPRPPYPPASNSQMQRIRVCTPTIGYQHLPGAAMAFLASCTHQPKHFSNIICILRTAHLGEMVLVSNSGRWFCRRHEKELEGR